MFFYFFLPRLPRSLTFPPSAEGALGHNQCVRFQFLVPLDLLHFLLSAIILAVTGSGGYKYVGVNLI